MNQTIETAKIDYITSKKYDKIVIQRVILTKVSPVVIATRCFYDINWRLNPSPVFKCKGVP